MCPAGQRALLSRHSKQETMLGQCWASVADGGTTLTQLCIRISCLLGSMTRILTNVSHLNAT